MWPVVHVFDRVVRTVVSSPPGHTFQKAFRIEVPLEECFAGSSVRTNDLTLKERPFGGIHRCGYFEDRLGRQRSLRLHAGGYQGPDCAENEGTPRSNHGCIIRCCLWY